MTTGDNVTPGPPFGVLYLAGSGRSGTTVLGRLLAADPAVASAGEVIHLPPNRTTGYPPCGCGRPLGVCPFWVEVELRAAARGGRSPDEVLTRALASINRRRAVPRLLKSQWRAGTGSDRELLALARWLSQLYPAIHEVTGARVIIDTSKSPFFGLLLTRLGFPVHVVHLVRDPRAVAYSWVKSVGDPDWEFVRLPRPDEVARRWDRTQLLVTLLRGGASSFQTVRYEDFAATPGPVVARIRRQVSLVADAHGIPPDGRVELPMIHSACGNPNQLKDTHVTIRVDERWRRELDPKVCALVSRRTWPLRWVYRYRGK